MHIFVLYTFFISNDCFQLSLSVAKLAHELSFKCCLGVAYYIQASSYLDTSYIYHKSRPNNIFMVSL